MFIQHNHIHSQVGGQQTKEAGPFVWFWFSQDSEALSQARSQHKSPLRWAEAGLPQRPRNLKPQALLSNTLSEGEGGDTGRKPWTVEMNELHKYCVITIQSPRLFAWWGWQNEEIIGLWLGSCVRSRQSVISFLHFWTSAQRQWHWLHLAGK